MKIKSTLLLAVAGLFVAQLFSSCNSVEITKRRYNKGFHVDLGGSTKATTPVNRETATVTPAASNEIKAVELTPSNINEVREQLNTLTASTKNIVAKKALRKISREVEALSAASVSNDKGATVSAETAVKKEMRKEKKAKHANAGGKSQLVALLLVIFVGGLGIHRFYLGYTWQGVVQLLTGGGCVIWALIDLVRIATGDLQPKGGSYEKTL